MSETKIIVRKNSLGLPADQITRIEKMVDSRQIYPISADKEPGLFLMYCMGDSLDEIAENTSIPKDIVALTALTYDWQNKASEVRKYQNGDKVAEIQKDLINTLLMATYVSIKRELALVIAGKKDAYDVLLIPKKVDGLEKLMKLVSELNNPEQTAAIKSAAGGGTIVQAQNVQINQQVKSVDGEAVLSKADKLRKLRGE